jgi:hypothetical protein
MFLKRLRKNTKILYRDNLWASKYSGQETYEHNGRSEVFTAVTMKNAVFWDVGPCRSCANLEPCVHTNLQRHIPEDGILPYEHKSERLQSEST